MLFLDSRLLAQARAVSSVGSLLERNSRGYKQKRRCEDVKRENCAFEQDHVECDPCANSRTVSCHDVTYDQKDQLHEIIAWLRGHFPRVLKPQICVKAADKKRVWRDEILGSGNGTLAHNSRREKPCKRSSFQRSRSASVSAAAIVSHHLCSCAINRRVWADDQTCLAVATSHHPLALTPADDRNKTSSQPWVLQERTTIKRKTGRRR